MKTINDPPARMTQEPAQICEALTLELLNMTSKLQELGDAIEGSIRGMPSEREPPATLGDGN